MIIRALAAGVAVFFCLISGTASGEGIGAITAVEGRVTIRRADGTVIESAKLSESVYPQDVVETASDAKVKILFDDEILVILGPDSSALMKEHVFTPRSNFRRFIIFLKKGSVRSILDKLYSADSSFGIETNNAVAGVVGTDFVVEYDERNILTKVGVLTGRAKVTSRFVEGVSIVAGGEYTEVSGEGRAPSAPRPMEPGMKKRLMKLSAEEETLSRQKSPPEKAELVRQEFFPHEGITQNPQVDVVGPQPIFIGGPFGAPAGPAPAPVPGGGGGGGGAGTSGRFDDLGEFLGGPRP